MNKELEIKMVPFLGTELIAARDTDGQIWAGVRWMCDGIGLSRNQRDNQIQKIKTETVLSKGAGNFPLPTKGGLQDALCLKLDFVPLWLAKIGITPAMKDETPDLADRLEQYQLKAKDVLAAAFLPEAVTSVAPAASRPTVMPPFGELSRYLGKMIQVMEKNGQPAEIVSDAFQRVSIQAGVDLPPNFVKRPTFQQINIAVWQG